MIELVMTVCLLAQPDDCRKERLPFDGTETACAMAGHFVVATWTAEHPAWRVTRWRCGVPEREI